MDPKVMYALSYGMFVLCARQGVKDNGCITNTGMQITEQPNRMAFTVSKRNYTHDMVLETGAFTLSVLSEDADFGIYERFGYQSGRTVDKFAGFEAHTARGDNGVLYLTAGTNAWIAGKVYDAIDLGSHTLFLTDVTGGDFLSEVPSATYAYYQSSVKPKPAAAPTGEKKHWVCKVCGYVYEGDELPADFICPWCKHPASDFELMG